ncbi:ribosome biogenesis GTP-binding protein YihA/YsxC [Elstera cyanobacteriorum]
MGDHAAPGGGVSQPAPQGPLEGMTPSDWAAAVEFGRKLFAGPCDFVAAVPTIDRLPPITLTEVAFAGRSNVGKSSLVNALTGRSTLARTSNTPGRTQQLNFFSLGEKLLLVDMPGYGYAEVPKAEAARWAEVIDLYLRGRASLRRVCLLVDARHGVKKNDLDSMDWLDQRAVPYQIVLTKADKLKQKDREDLLAATAKTISRRPAAHPDIIVTSAETGEGIPALRAVLGLFAAA